jgi:hypothetical protein
MMILHPEIQQKVQAELDQLPPKIELSHRNKLTYLQATINVSFTANLKINYNFSGNSTNCKHITN